MDKARMEGPVREVFGVQDRLTRFLPAPKTLLPHPGPHRARMEHLPQKQGQTHTVRYAFPALKESLARTKIDLEPGTN